MFNIKMDMIQTVGLAVIILILGRFLRTRVKIFETYCIPSPVIGGFLFAIINLILRQTNFKNLSKFEVQKGKDFILK